MLVFSVRRYHGQSDPDDSIVLEMATARPSIARTIATITGDHTAAKVLLRFLRAESRCHRLTCGIEQKEDSSYVLLFAQRNHGNGRCKLGYSEQKSGIEGLCPDRDGCHGESILNSDHNGCGIWSERNVLQPNQ